MEGQTDQNGVETAARRVSEDLEHQQLRILLLIATVAEIPGTGKKLDGLTKLAKLDFIARYPAMEGPMSDLLLTDASSESSAVSSRPPTTAPMIRYRYGPWDERYYLVIGALVGRGLVRYTRGRGGSVAMALTADGRRLASLLMEDRSWAPVAERYRQVASGFALYSGNRLKDAIYQVLPEIRELPFGTELQ